MTDSIRHLLGGYATGTLTPEENAVLMEAALDDQELFDALADDEALRRYLADPKFRKDLLKATAPRPARAPWIALLVVAATSLPIGFFWIAHRDKEPVVQMAVIRPPALEPPPVPTPAPMTKAAPSTGKQPVTKPPVEAKKEEPQVAKPQPELARGVVGGQVSTDGLAGNALSSAAPPVPPAQPIPKAAGRAGGSVAFAPRPIIRTEALARAAVLPSLTITGKITNVNAAIITVNVGTKAGVRIGDRLDLFHDNTNIGFITVNVTDLEYSIGKYTGENTPAVGDTAATPKK
jgi:hypothetical protein